MQKDNIPIDSIDNLAEILKAEINLVDKDIKISYNKVLTKAEAEVTFMYLTEDNRINKVTYKIPVVGFIDIQDVTEEKFMWCKLWDKKYSNQTKFSRRTFNICRNRNTSKM